MSEQELKKKANALRHEIDVRNKRISEIYDKLRVHQTEARNLRKQRDSLNEEVKELSIKVKNFKEKRDKLNKAVSELSSSRKTFVVEIKRLSSGIKDSKNIRDQLSKDARSTEELIEKVLEDKLSVLLKEDINLNDEKRLFDLILTLSHRLESAKTASEVHKKIVEDFKTIKDMSTRLDSLRDQLTDLSTIADEYHKKVLETYKQIKNKKEEANDAHKKLTEKYMEMNPLRSQMNSLKAEIKVLREELTPINEALNEIRRQREEKKKREMAMEVKEKLKISKRVSLEDLRVMLEHGGID